MKKIIFALLAIFFAAFNTSFAQCSDAGICSLGGHSMETEQKFIDLNLGYAYGYSGKDDEINYHSLNLGGTYHFSDQTRFNFILPYQMISGPIGETNGIGDLIVGLSQSFNINETVLSVSAGVKLPTGDDNQKNLPQAYQPGLGSTDILFGVDYSFSNFTLGAGYQIAGARNDNFLKLKRGDDLLFRAIYNYVTGDFTLNTQLLFIQRLDKSSIIYFPPDAVAATSNEYREIEKSAQSQLNLLLNISYQVNENYSIFGEAAVPFLEREVNVDGLTRAFSVSTGIRFSFKKNNPV